MADWERAEDVPEVCRAMRRTLAGFDPVTGELIATRQADPEEKNREEILKDEMQARAEGLRGLRGIPESNIEKNYDLKPSVSVVLAILATVFCFPFTGLVAVWYAMKSRAHWKMSEDRNARPREAADLRRKAHDDARLYRMMLGITLCLGLIMIGYTLSQMSL